MILILIGRPDFIFGATPSHLQQQQPKQRQHHHHHHQQQHLQRHGYVDFFSLLGD